MCRGWLWREERITDTLVTLRLTIYGTVTDKMTAGKLLPSRDVGRSLAPGYERFMQPAAPEGAAAKTQNEQAVQTLDLWLGAS